MSIVLGNPCSGVFTCCLAKLVLRDAFQLERVYETLDSEFPEVVDVPRVGLDCLDGVLLGTVVKGGRSELMAQALSSPALPLQR